MPAQLWHKCATAYLVCAVNIWKKWKKKTKQHQISENVWKRIAGSNCRYKSGGEKGQEAKKKRKLKTSK